MIMASIHLHPVVPLWILIPALLAAAWYFVQTLADCPVNTSKKRLLAGVRFGTFLLVFWMLLHGERRTLSEEEEKPILGVVLDHSVSMTETLGDASESRAENARDLLDARTVKGILDDFRVRYFTIGSDVVEVDDWESVTFNAAKSDLVNGLSGVTHSLKGENVAALLFLSDGLDQSGEAVSDYYFAVPVYVPELELPFRLEYKVKDVWIADVVYPETCVVGWKTGADVILRRSFKGKMSCPVVLYQEEKKLKTESVVFNANELFTQVHFEVEPETVGRRHYRVDILPDDDENRDNNRREFLLEVTDPVNNVLYVEQAPRWEFKFMKRALAAEKNAVLTAFVGSGDGAFINFSEGERAQRVKEFPDIEGGGLKEYKVLILGEMAGDLFSAEAWQKIHEFVENGGGLLFAGASTSLGRDGWASIELARDLLPVVSEEHAAMKDGKFSLLVTPEGGAHPAIQGLGNGSGLPPVLSHWGPLKTAESGEELITTASGSPILAVSRYGRGRTAALLSDSLWKWRLASVVGEEKLYPRLISQLVYWLSPKEKDLSGSGMLQVITPSGEVDVNTPVPIGAVIGTEQRSGRSPVCAIKSPTGKNMMFTMNAAELGAEFGLVEALDGYRCVFFPRESGKYSIEVSTPDGVQKAELSLLAREPYAEKTGHLINREFLKKVAKDSGGAFFRPDEAGKLLKQIPSDPETVTVLREYPLWNKVYVLVMALSLLAWEWWVRRRSDLI